MPNVVEARERQALNLTERLVAAVGGAVLVAVGVIAVANPPTRRVALAGCPNEAAGCVVRVDGDVTAFGIAIAALGAVACLLALLGVRFTSVKAGGVELGRGFDKATEGLPKAEPQPAEDRSVLVSPPTPDETTESDSPILVTVKRGLGEELGIAPVAITQLEEPMESVSPRLLRDYQSARRKSQKSYFLTHVLGPARHSGQKFAVAIHVTPHRDANERVTSASFYFGRAWGHQVFTGERGSDGRFGITTEAYGPFMALCEVEFADGTRLVLDHYCDFDMGALLTGRP